jgi:hypothetical protein
MERDRLTNEPFHFVSGVTDDTNSREVWAIGAPRLPLMLDYDQVLAHLLDLRNPA